MNYVILRIKHKVRCFYAVIFKKTFEFADKDSVIYCDPPYAPLQQETNFTGYAGNEFGLAQQRVLADLAKSIQKRKTNFDIDLESRY